MGLTFQDGCWAALTAFGTGFAAEVVSAASLACALSCAGGVLGKAGVGADGEAVRCAAAELPDDPGPTTTATPNTRAIPEAALIEK